MFKTVYRDFFVKIPVEPSVSSSCRDLLVSLLQRDPLQRISFEDFFAHQFVDLEHKPSACCVQKAVSIWKMCWSIQPTDD